MSINPRLRRQRQRGVFAVEFAMLALLFFLFLFAMLEMARAVYMWNMVHEITRRAARAAAVTDFSNAGALQAVRTHAVLRATPGTLPLGGGLGDAHVRIDYLSESGGGAALAALPVTVLPGCPQRNRINCLDDPHGASCIRFVRARLCQPGVGARCERVPYRPILPLLGMMFPSGAGAIRLPSGTTMAVAESLGYADNPGFCP
ncbi:MULTISPECIES: TadE/TadG family type IV pilus assembly protein [unclassified Janthinobacterium]|uniref:TadE/TadG family type IV pilus assembly protein n=1 Tax=unclassified Janthinobacterium TaxID=2610881 RepID=UPI0025B5D1F3|nr:MULTISPECIES: TadE/TadG family type IV pilus assembly protein [unclassified Janthinobacterium]MDN2703982.1 pilus assembly protein [Janthinobacterium sp. SUN100]MDN2717392.1 pilus assembly protein [Janthinobacterium sp. SUN120]MDO8041723.1 TadE/TadG family type IV pilus assembly protein [Janthinobacterium sp. SUN137]